MRGLLDALDGGPEHRGLFQRSEKDRSPYQYQRAGLLPLGINPFTGRAELAVPGFLHDIPGLLQAPGDVLTGQKEATLEDALGLAGLMFPGNLPYRTAGYKPSTASTSASGSGSVGDPLKFPQRPFSDDYVGPIDRPTAAPLTHTMDGAPIEARYIAGRRTVGGMDEGLSPGDVEKLARQLVPIVRTGTKAELGRNNDGIIRHPGGVPREIVVGDWLPGSPSEGMVPRATGSPAWGSPYDRVLAHETGHAVGLWADDLTVSGRNRQALQARQVYNDLNNPSMSPRVGPRYDPETAGYRGKIEVSRELSAEAIRAYLQDPNYIKTVAPELAAELRRRINTHPVLSKEIQLNSGSGLAAMLMSQPGWGDR